MLFRAYIDKKKGNEHVRVFDAEAVSEDAFRDMLQTEVKKTEVVGQVQTLHTETAADFEAIVYRVAEQLEKKGGLTREDAIALATETVLSHGE